MKSRHQDSDYTRRRWQEEVAQAEKANDEHAKAAHSELADRYAERLETKNS